MSLTSTRGLYNGLSHAILCPSSIAKRWRKRLEVVADVLPPRDAHLAGHDQDAAAALNRS